mmetsp:Transcript_14954/g.34504  ORF Transcript_14954/g.34504 Transcript_14954/m.34504 type:complete len:216 (+) Transcript_14954:226-873(+)
MAGSSTRGAPSPTSPLARNPTPGARIRSKTPPFPSTRPGKSCLYRMLFQGVSGSMSSPWTLWIFSQPARWRGYSRRVRGSCSSGFGSRTTRLVSRGTSMPFSPTSNWKSSRVDRPGVAPRATWAAAAAAAAIASPHPQLPRPPAPRALARPTRRTASESAPAPVATRPQAGRQRGRACPAHGRAPLKMPDPSRQLPARSSRRSASSTSHPQKSSS